MSKRFWREILVGIVASIIAAGILGILSRIGVLVLGLQNQAWGIYIYIAVIAFGFYFLGVAVSRRLATSTSAKEQRALIVSEMQNMILFHWAGEGPTVYMNKSPRLEPVQLHVCNRVPDTLKLKHITFNVVVNSEYLQESQRYFDQTIQGHDCCDLMFTLALNTVTADKLQSLDPCIVNFQGRAAVSVGDLDFAVFFKTATTFRVFLDPDSLQS